MSISSVSLYMVSRYPLNTRMDATSKAAAEFSSIPPSPFTEQGHVRCMSQITPIVVGISKITRLLGAVDALTQYQGGRMRRRFKPSDASDQKVTYRLHHLRPVEHKGDALNTRVGLGRGWEKMYQGVPVDSPRRKFKM